MITIDNIRRGVNKTGYVSFKQPFMQKNYAVSEPGEIDIISY